MLLVVCLLLLGGCGTGHQVQLRIEGDRSFGGMPNPGSLSEAIARFGYPDQIYGRAQDTIDCFAGWKQYGIKALFQDWGAAGGGQTCAPHKDFILTSVELRGPWSTDRGLKVGDSVDHSSSRYGIRRGVRCGDEVGAEKTTAWTIRSIKDKLGGPGSRLCTLGVIVAKGRIVGFTLSNLDADE